MTSGSQVDEVKTTTEKINSISIFTVSQDGSHSVQKLKLMLIYLVFTVKFAQHKRIRPHTHWCTCRRGSGVSWQGHRPLLIPDRAVWQLPNGGDAGGTAHQPRSLPFASVWKGSSFCKKFIIVSLHCFLCLQFSMHKTRHTSCKYWCTYAILIRCRGSVTWIRPFPDPQHYLRTVKFSFSLPLKYGFSA